MNPLVPCRSCRHSLFIRPQRAVSTSAPSQPSPPKHRRWLGVLAVGTAAAGAGAYYRSETSNSSATLNPDTFTKYRLVSREPVSATSSIFTLCPRTPSAANYDVYEEAWRTGIWSVMFKQPQLQIGRDYTPLPTTAATTLSVDEENEGYLQFFIRKDPFGEVSRYLHNLDIGAEVEIRGPQIECAIPEDTRDILFIAGGTGIAPALQAGYSLLSRRGEARPRIHILWANRRSEDCLGGQSDTLQNPSPSHRSWFSGWFGASESSSATVPPTIPEQEKRTSLIVRELEALKSQYPGQVTVDYYLDEQNTFIGTKDILRFTESTRPADSSRRSKLIMVSGPDGFISYMAGPKLWAQGKELQGPLQGIIKELDLKEWAVWKL
ncbi:hypothetical protein N7474_002615 [Penicillium riverlandense]|uniref:uncharacterized protein n=1 Tax=Penicillium riverlandense TaxID=1903569 RepID=UPI0025481A3E|nr:uncharacterized protein N7474_002615 [Penicillium riverlandense]KAJ5825477.1 hypothetical protein N7474_002615 [Penicillium riverlandense]